MSELHESETSPVTDTTAQSQEDARLAMIAAIEAALDAEEAVEEVVEPEQAVVEPEPEQTVVEPEPEPETAPKPEAEEPEPEQPFAPPAVRAVTPWWPFLMYLGVWLGSVGATGWLFTGLPQGSTLYGSDPYEYMVLGGIGLTLIGPALTLIVWLVSCLRAKPGHRAGLLSSSLVRGALVTLAGVAVWWGMLVVVDVLRLGRPW